MKKVPMDNGFYELARDDMPCASCRRSWDNGCMPHFHSSVEMVYVEEGELTAILDGQKYTVPSGHLLLTSSYSVHAYRTEEGQHNSVVVIIIPLPSVPSLQKKLNGKAFGRVVYDAREDREIRTLIPLMADRWKEYGEEIWRGYSQLLLSLVVQRAGLKNHPGNQQSGLMRDVLIYLQNHYQQPLRMESLARQFGYSKSRFSRLFHDHLGCSMIDYLAVLRCRQAAQLLLESDMTMLDIALNVGFECLRTFYRAFKDCYHMTPTQYIRLNTDQQRLLSSVRPLETDPCDAVCGDD